VIAILLLAVAIFVAVVALGVVLMCMTANARDARPSSVHNRKGERHV
jgi:flagellar basal body-associated protein FliL